MPDYKGGYPCTIRNAHSDGGMPRGDFAQEARNKIGGCT